MGSITMQLDNMHEQLRQNEAEAKSLAGEINQFNKRITELGKFEQAIVKTSITEKAPMSTTTREPSRSPDNLHTQTDLFTHFSDSCPSRSRRRGFDTFHRPVKKCKRCYNSALTMNLKDWRPKNHKKTLKKYPALLAKELRDNNLIMTGPAGPDGRRGRVKRVVDEYADFYTSGESDSEIVSSIDDFPVPEYADLPQKLGTSPERPRDISVISISSADIDAGVDIVTNNNVMKEEDLEAHDEVNTSQKPTSHGYNNDDTSRIIADSTDFSETDDLATNTNATPNISNLGLYWRRTFSSVRNLETHHERRRRIAR